MGSMVYSEIESKRFGLRIYRGQYEGFDMGDVETVIEKNNFDIIIVRYPTVTIYDHYRLANINNCKTIHADSLVYYSSPLQEITIKPLRNDLEFEVIAQDVNGRLEFLINNIFTGYQNHYYSNPCLPRHAIIDGYFEWALSFATARDNGITWLIKDRKTNADVAFLACYFDEKESVSELKLGGVLPEYAGNGIYSDFVRYAQDYFKRKGIRSLLTSTQLQNVAVQRTWQRHGFRFDKSYETYHLVSNDLWNLYCKKAEL